MVPSQLPTEAAVSAPFFYLLVPIANASFEERAMANTYTALIGRPKEHHQNRQFSKSFKYR
eukprot:scaffold6927_cov93-Cylindrotheca_fusiformis.AAC.1